LRSSIRRACRATGTPAFSPHGLRKRRGSLLGKQGYSLAEIAERLGDTKVVTAEHYLYAIGDYAEVDYEDVLQRERTAAGVLQEPAGTPPRSHTGSHIANIVSLKPFD